MSKKNPSWCGCAIFTSAKHGKYDDGLEDGCSFEAYILEVFGTWGEEARGRLESLAKIVQAEGEQLGDRFAGSRFIQRWQQRIGVTLQRGNAVALIRRSRADMRWRSGRSGRPIQFDISSQ